jgi:hypothetical protein
MNHPIIIAVPVAMLLDYFLTILGARAASGVYRQHFIVTHYEINPLWRKAVQKLRWFNPIHLALVCIVTGAFVWLDRSTESGSVDWLTGLFFGVFALVLGRHFSNLLLFRYLNRHPAEIEGQVQFTQKLLVIMSLFNNVAVLPFVWLLAVLAPGPMTIGALVGVLAFCFAHLVWAGKRPQKKRVFIGLGIAFLALAAIAIVGFVTVFCMVAVDNVRIERLANEWVQEATREAEGSFTPDDAKQWLQDHGFGNVGESSEPLASDLRMLVITGSRHIGDRESLMPQKCVDLHFYFTTHKKRLVLINHEVRRVASE